MGCITVTRLHHKDESRGEAFCKTYDTLAYLLMEVEQT